MRLKENNDQFNFIFVNTTTMKTKFTETIDGSIKSILQLKTLDNSLEFS